MPIYEYECPECGEVNEMLTSINDSKSIVNLKCKKCKNFNDMKKLVSKSTFKLEGRGWGKDGYENTYETAKELI